MNKLPYNIVNQRFGRFVIVARNENNKAGKAQFICKCDCGKIAIVSSRSLRNGDTKSCGCLLSEKSRERAIKHGLRQSRLYRIYYGMKARCNNSNNVKYAHYGGRGISVCAEWRDDFKAFYDWAMSRGYSDDLTIDRVDVNGNYEPSNCRWATYTQQNLNRRVK